MASSRGRWASPERTVVWTEPPPKTTSATTRRHGHAHAAPPTKVPVVYYLSRNGQLDHPHFMEVPVSSPQDGLCLRDVLDRLAVLRGAGMADAYSWSSKRSYKTGYVWHDLTADDPVHPASGAEYVLKGSELLRLLPAPAYPRDDSAGSSSSSSSSSCQAGSETTKKMPAAAVSRAHGRRKNWSSFDLGEYRVAAARGGAGADAATQTDDRCGRRRGPEPSPPQEPTTELGADEISPPPSSSSPDTLEALINNDVRVAAASNAIGARREDEDAGLAQQSVIAGGRMRASAVLMQLISCGSIPAAPKRDAGPGGARYTAERRLPRGRSDLSSSTAADGFSGSIGVGASMEREYFSGSLVETKKSASGDRAGVGELGALKRSSSYNADRGRESAMNTAASGSCKLELAAEEVDGVRARCIPAGRKPSGGSSSKKSPTTHVHVSSRRGDQPETTDNGRTD
ncbi:unnamed protein product [Triticum turgidum subsp. durum]|uniref:SOSEKI DIX-like domain-containing protein n=2 Tax=Triticum turgidum subsp. durum TaxID=4567 RepID=A0A9R0S1I9_TRITD|nr:unnamed protein product [Triticum turgidum subsp. durum]